VCFCAHSVGLGAVFVWTSLPVKCPRGGVPCIVLGEGGGCQTSGGCEGGVWGNLLFCGSRPPGPGGSPPQSEVRRWGSINNSISWSLVGGGEGRLLHRVPAVVETGPPLFFRLVGRAVQLGTGQPLFFCPAVRSRLYGEDAPRFFSLRLFFSKILYGKCHIFFFELTFFR